MLSSPVARPFHPTFLVIHPIATGMCKSRPHNVILAVPVTDVFPES